jgi:hypothetical protein
MKISLARVFCRGWRGGDEASRGAVLVVLPVAAHPSVSSHDRFAHEHGLKDELDRAWAVRPLEIVRHHSQPDRAVSVGLDFEGDRSNELG